MYIYRTLSLPTALNAEAPIDQLRFDPVIRRHHTFVYLRPRKGLIEHQHHALFAMRSAPGRMKSALDAVNSLSAPQIGRAWKKQLGVDGRRGLRGMRDYFKPWDFPELQISPGPEITSVTCPFHVTNPAIPANPAFRIILPAPRRSISLV